MLHLRSYPRLTPVRLFLQLVHIMFVLRAFAGHVLGLGSGLLDRFGLALVAAVALYLRSSPCSSSGSKQQSATYAAVVQTLCTMSCFASTLMCAFNPKDHWLLLRNCYISGSRSCFAYLVQEGAWSMIVPVAILISFDFRWIFTASSISPHKWCCSNR
jgi:hypothetical protein